MIGRLPLLPCDLCHDPCGDPHNLGHEPARYPGARWGIGDKMVCKACCVRLDLAAKARAVDSIMLFRSMDPRDTKPEVWMDRLTEIVTAAVAEEKEITVTPGDREALLGQEVRSGASPQEIYREATLSLVAQVGRRWRKNRVVSRKLIEDLVGV